MKTQEDLERLRADISEALAEENRGEFQPLGIEAIKARGRVILEKECDS